MSQYETIHTYWERWKLAEAACVASGNAKMDTTVLMELFNKSLHSGYGSYKADIENRRITGRELPKTLAENFWQACNFVSVPTSVSTTDTRAVYFTGDQQAAMNRKKPKSKDKKAVANAQKQGGKDGKKNSKDKSKKPDPDWLSKQTCYGCRKQSHLIADCPDVDHADAEANDEKAGAARHFKICCRVGKEERQSLRDPNFVSSLK